MKNNIAKTTEQFKEYQAIVESLGNTLFDIPGFYKVAAHLKNDNIEVQLSNADILWIDLKDLKSTASDEYNLDPRFLNALGKLYQASVGARYIADIGNKIKTIKSAEGYQLFDIEKGGFFSKIEDDLCYLGASKEDCDAIIMNLPQLYDKGVTDGISPEGVAIFVEYLNSILEFIGAKVYIYLEYLGKDDVIIKRVQLGNIDKVMESEAIKTGQAVLPLGADSYESYSDYQRGIEMIIRVVDKACKLAKLTPGTAQDLYTGRKVNATTIYITVPIKDTDLQVTAILSPVEMKKITGNSFFTFNVESEDGYIDKEFMGLTNEVQIANALKKLK